VNIFCFKLYFFEQSFKQFFNTLQINDIFND